MYAYSWMENQLCELFSNLVDCEDNVAAKIFFNMDYRRYKVMSELIQENYEKGFEVFLDVDEISKALDFKKRIENFRRKLVIISQPHSLTYSCMA